MSTKDIHIPSDIEEFGQRHGIPNFANATYVNGYVEGSRAARTKALEEAAGLCDRCEREKCDKFRAMKMDDTPKEIRRRTLLAAQCASDLAAGIRALIHKPAPDTDMMEAEREPDPIKQFVDAQTPLGPEFARVWDENAVKLYEGEILSAPPDPWAERLAEACDRLLNGTNTANALDLDKEHARETLTEYRSRNDAR